MKQLRPVNQERLNLTDLKDFQQIALVSGFSYDFNIRKKFTFFIFQNRWNTTLTITRFLPISHRCVISPNNTAIKILGVISQLRIFWIKIQIGEDRFEQKIRSDGKKRFALNFLDFIQNTYF